MEFAFYWISGRAPTTFVIDRWLIPAGSTVSPLQIPATDTLDIVKGHFVEPFQHTLEPAIVACRGFSCAKELSLS